MRIRFSTQVFLSLFVAVTVWICYADGLLSRPEALLYRWGLRLTHLRQPPSSPLLLVEVSPTQLRRQEATMLPRLLGTLEQLGTPLEVNLRMHELLKDEAIAPHELTIVDSLPG